MQTYTSSYSHHSAALATAGYVQLQSSVRGRLYYIPTHIYQAIYPEIHGTAALVLGQSHPVFHSRTVRPHRIHIARVHAELGLGTYSPPTPKKTKQKRPSASRRNSVAVIVGKTSGIKISAKRILRLIKSSPLKDTIAVAQAEFVNELSPVSTSGNESAQINRRPIRTVSDTAIVPSTAPSSSASEANTSNPPSRKPSLRRPESWAPGFNSDNSRMRPSLLLSRRESKRRSTAAASMPSAASLRNSVSNLAMRSSPVQTAAPNAALLPTEDLSLNGGAGSPRLSSSTASVVTNGNGPTRTSPPLRPNRIAGKMAMVEEKPLASGTGVTVSIALAEPFLFVQGFEHSDLQASRSTAMLRGTLKLKVTKPTKIKAVSLKFKGTASTKWPEGIPNKKSEYDEVNTLMSHTWPFFNAQFVTAEYSTGADQVELALSPTNRSATPKRTDEPTTNSSGNLMHNKRGSLDIRDLLNRANTGSSSNLSTSNQDKRLSLQIDNARPSKNDSGEGPSVAQKGYKVFQPGDYVYNFELPLDSHLPETISVELGAVKYELEATVERSGAFRGNLVGTKEVVLIRTPAEGSLEQVEPIAIARTWDDQLHYDIVISGKSFPMGSQIPIAFKLTPLAKVHCHRIKVYITEAVEYYCDNRRVHRTEPARRMLLCEKRSDGKFLSTYPGSTMRIVSGGGIPYDMRAAAARGEEVQGVDSTNLLGRLESKAAHDIGPTELEICAQLPTCENLRMEKDKMARLHPDTTYTNIQVHHWIKIVLRLSRPDAVDPTKRRHFEISIDSPFHILNCRAREGNLFVPAYAGNDAHEDQGPNAECGCPGARLCRRRTDTSSTSPHPLSRELDRVDSAGLSRPQAAHVHNGRMPADSMAPRPMHFIRVPSYNPPAFDAEEPPPPLETPPPVYETIASPTGGLADYFARYSDAYATPSSSSDSTTTSAEVEDDVEEVVVSDGSSDGDGERTPTGRRSPA